MDLGNGLRKALQSVLCGLQHDREALIRESRVCLPSLGLSAQLSLAPGGQRYAASSASAGAGVAVQLLRGRQLDAGISGRRPPRYNPSAADDRPDGGRRFGGPRGRVVSSPPRKQQATGRERSARADRVRDRGRCRHCPGDTAYRIAWASIATATGATAAASLAAAACSTRGTGQALVGGRGDRPDGARTQRDRPGGAHDQRDARGVGAAQLEQPSPHRTRGP